MVLIHSENHDHVKLPNKVIIYSNTQKQILTFVEKLENFLDSDKKMKEIDVLTLVGTQSQVKKAAVINMLVNSP